VMSGYTNFMIGSITNRTVMIPIDEVISGNYSDQLVEHSNHWARLLLITSQPAFINE
jgi:6-phosphofructokinase 1